MQYRLLAFCVVTLLLASCSLFETDNTEPPAPLVDFNASLTPTVLWSQSTGRGSGDFKLMPTLSQGRVFTSSVKGLVTAIEVDSGKVLWEMNTKLPLSSGAGVGTGHVVVGARNGILAALSETDGKPLWRVQLSSEVIAAPQIDSNVVVVRTVDGKVYALNVYSGAKIWVYERDIPILSLWGNSPPVISQTWVIAGLDNGKLAVLNLQTGKLLWEANVAIPHGRTELERLVDIDAKPIVSDGVVYVTSYQGRTVAGDLYSSKLLWERDISSYAGLAVDNESVYISDAHSHIWAVSRASGVSLWKQTKLQARVITAPVVMGNYLVVGDIEGYVHWMRKDNGEFVARYRTGSKRINVPPLVIDEQRVLVYNSRGELQLLRLSGK
jgi:outer membrane protein assembly factor BamB